MQQRISAIIYLDMGPIPYHVAESGFDERVGDDARVVVEDLEGRCEQPVLPLVETDDEDEVHRAGPRLARTDARQTLRLN